MEKIVVAIIVYNRFENVKRWIKCWNMCDQMGGELVIIHNYDESGTKYTEPFMRIVKEYCEGMGIKYVPRHNVGADIGAFQDVCKSRLKGFDNEWDYLLWVTDDVFPMTTDFLKTYISRMKEPGVGCVCMEISNEHVPHVRTSGFMIQKEFSRKIVFPADPMTTKEECWKFEHRGANILMKQVGDWGLKAVQVSDDASAVLWDTGHRGHMRNMSDHYAIFPDENKVPLTSRGNQILFICLIFNSYPGIISSLLLQSHPNWRLWLIHDGPNSTGLARIVENVNDKRITYLETKDRIGNWGHEWRRWALDEIKAKRAFPDCDYIVVTNADNYYTPVFCQMMLGGIDENVLATYCSQMVHSYTGWSVINCKMERGHIDAGNVMIRSDVACDVGWRKPKMHSADWFYFNDIMTKYGRDKFAMVPGCLFVHN
jgi:hypothetical protein